jgi:hypothetical protein
MFATRASSQANSLQVAVAGVIAAPVDRVFPLCCPVQEYWWIPGWRCELLHCPQDRVEVGCQFREVLSAPFLMRAGRGKTTWTAIRHEPAEHRLHFVLDNEVSSSLYKIEMIDDGAGGTRVHLDLTFRAAGERGRALIAQGAERRIHAMLGLLAAMLQHYCEHGVMLHPAALVLLVLRSRDLHLGDKLRLARSQLSMLLLPDRDRRRLFSHRGGRV